MNGDFTVKIHLEIGDFFDNLCKGNLTSFFFSHPDDKSDFSVGFFHDFKTFFFQSFFDFIKPEIYDLGPGKRF